MGNFKKLIAAFLLGAAATMPAFADVTQTLSISSTDQYYNYNPGSFTIGDMYFARGVESISALTSTVALADQGWGYEAPFESGVFVQLMNNSNVVLRFELAGATHQMQTISYSLADHKAEFAELNSTISQLNGVDGSHLSLRFATYCVGYPGWELHTRDAAFSVTFSNLGIPTTPVPEPETYAMLLAGIGLMGAVARRRKSHP